MTDASVPVPDDEAVTRWLTAQQKCFADGLTGLLDVAAGLREVLIYARHGDLVSDLGHALDVESGLAAILPPAATVSGREPIQAPKDHEAGRPELNREIEALTPQKRLALRTHPAVIASIRGDLVLRAVSLVGDITRAGDLARDDARASDLATTHDLLRAYGLADAGDLATDLVHDLARAVDLARISSDKFAPDVARRLADARDFARDVVRDLARSGGFVRAIASAHSLAYTLTRDLADDLGRLSYGLDRRALGLDLDQALAHFRDFNSGIAHAQDLARALERGRARNLVLAHDLAHGLDQAVGLLLGLHDVEGLGIVLLDGPLDDFTWADLREVDLAGVDLAGVRWSEWGTRWPSTVDIEQLKSDSQETEPGSGVYVVRRGTTTGHFVRV